VPVLFTLHFSILFEIIQEVLIEIGSLEWQILSQLLFSEAFREIGQNHFRFFPMFNDRDPDLEEKLNLLQIFVIDSFSQASSSICSRLKL
jgi:hypothetical protein